MFLIYLSSSWLAGIYTGGYTPLTPLLMLTALIPLPLLFLFPAKRRTIILLSLCFLTFFGAVWYSYASQHQLDETALNFYHDRDTVILKGTVSRPPEVTDQNTRFPFETTEINLAGGWQDVKGTVLLFVPRYAEYEYGDVLQVTGVPQTPPRFEDFDYRGYLTHQGIDTIIRYPRIEILERGQG
ncbi:ComEC/Rec2 family competence protein [Chloroflexota bacterium]